MRLKTLAIGSAILVITWLLFDLLGPWAPDVALQELRRSQAAHQAAREALSRACDALEAEAAELNARLIPAHVRVVGYLPTGQITASGRKARPGRTCAVSRGLKERLGLRWGDLALIPGHGVRVVEDLMGQEIRGDSLDLLLRRGQRPGREMLGVTFLKMRDEHRGDSGDVVGTR